MCCFLRYELYTVCALRAVHRVLVLGSLPASGMKDIQIQISDDRHRRHAANLATKTQPIFRSHTRRLLFPERKRLCEIENGGFSICNFSFSISHKSRPYFRKCFMAVRKFTNIFVLLLILMVGSRDTLFLVCFT